MKERTYLSMFEIELTKEMCENIFQEMKKEKDFERKLSEKNYPEKIVVVKCDCSDGDIYDDEVCEGYFDKDFPLVIFCEESLMKDKEKNTLCGVDYNTFGHELVHLFQNIVYLYFDFEDKFEKIPPSQRWEEIMADKFQLKVNNLISAKTLNPKLVSNDGDEICYKLIQQYKK